MEREFAARAALLQQQLSERETLSAKVLSLLALLVQKCLLYSYKSTAAERARDTLRQTPRHSVYLLY
jgi:hypothetical protein